MYYLNSHMQKRRLIKANILLFAWVIIAGCHQGNNREKYTPPAPASKEDLKEALIHQNRQLIREEMEHINAYEERHGLAMDTTSTGLHYLITEKTMGRKAGLMKDVTISYKAGLLDGSVCYSSDSAGLLTFTLGQSNQPSGLQEGLLLMREGEKAMMIVPSYLAYGVTGDGVCVPGSSSVIFHVKLEKVTE
jgi:FKBP-type peptidyl-prolyl cis-trans isomerase FkpA